MSNYGPGAVRPDLKRALGKRGRTAAQLAEKLGRPHGKGLGPALNALIREGSAVRNPDGTYSKA